MPAPGISFIFFLIDPPKVIFSQPMKFAAALYLIFSCSIGAFAQMHAHNDYEKPEPFTNAYEYGAGSIEVDIFLHKGELLVAHDTSQFDRTRTIASLYLRPLDSVITAGKIRQVQLLIDIKTEAYSTLQELLEVLKRYPHITRSDKISLVISGNRPAPGKFKRYPAYILFDGLLQKDYSRKALKRVPMFSDNFKNYSGWSDLVPAIRKAHQLGKTIRFWNAPDNLDAWQQLMRLKVDWINTDQVKECSAFLRSLSSRDSAQDSLSN